MKKRVLSFDVGIRNLAFCLLEEKKDIHIVPGMWDVLDLLCPQRCGVCKLPAQFTLEDSTSYCKKHAEKAGARIRPTPVGMTALRKLTKVKLLDVMHNYGMKDVDESTKKPQLVESFDAYLSQRFATPIKAGRGAATYTPSPILAQRLCAVLAPLDEKLVPATDIVVIEQQMKSKMREVGMAICMYYTLRGHEVRFISARHKLTVNASPIVSRTYKERKVEGVRLCMELIPPAMKTFLQGNKKKDDLCDSYLQGRWVLEQQQTKKTDISVVTPATTEKKKKKQKTSV
jgi:hypothetical protein